MHLEFLTGVGHYVNKRVSYPCTQRKNVRKLRYGLCLQIFQASWAKNYDLLRVIAVHGTMTIKFYVEF